MTASKLFRTTAAALLCGAVASIAIAHEHDHAAPTTAPATKPTSRPHSRPAGIGVTSLDVYRDAGGRLHVLTVDDPGEAPAGLRYSRSDDGGETWTPAVAVGVGQDGPDIAHRGMDVQIAAAGDWAVAVWTTAGTEDRFGRGPIATSVSADGGKTWRPGPNPADDGAATGHAFVDVAADEGGAFHCVWLDSRTGTKGLRYARSTDGGTTWSANQTLVPVTCECCWNALATAPGGKVWVLYRQASPRDMAVIGSADGGKTWGPPSTAGGFGWDFKACPHVGGGIAQSPDATAALHAVVWTNKGGVSGVHVLASPDAGKTWSAPRQLGDWKASHPDLAVASGGRVVVAWDTLTDTGTAIFAATSTDGGKSWSDPRRLSLPNASPTHPRVVVAGDGFRVIWTQGRTGEPSVMRSAVLK